jgi:uncharacterized protein
MSVGPSFQLRDQHAVDVEGRHYRMVIDSASVVEVGHVPRRILEAADGNGSFTASEIARSLREEIPAHVVNEALDECVLMDLLEPVGNGNGNGNGNGHVAVQPELIAPAEPPPGLGQMGSLTLHVAHTCNMKCGYCYADFGLYGGPASVMTADRAREYLDRLFASCGDTPEVSVQFFGGEPLLNYSVVQQATEYAIEKARAHEKRIRFGLTTNGLLLDEAKADWLGSRGFTLTVSIDGPKETNDRIRPTSCGGPTYDRIVAVVPLLRKFPKAGARVTVTHQNLDVERIVTHLAEAGFPEIGVSNVTSSDPEYALTEDDYATLLVEFRNLAKRFVDDALQGRLFPFSNIRNVMTQIHDGTARTHPCGAGIRLFAGTPEGGLYLCHRFAGNDDFKMGDVETGIDTMIQSDLLQSLDVRKKPECETCWLRTLCAGGCHHVSHEQAGDACGVDPALCPWLREWFHVGLETYVRLGQEAPEFLSRILGESDDCFQAP